MSTQVSNAFVKQYEREVHEAYQRMGSYLRSTVRTKSNVIGSSTTFQKVGKGTASTKARHSLIPTMNQDHTPIECTLADWYAADWVDKLDELKTNIDERMVVTNGGAYALGRKTDELIITALDGTTNVLSGGYVALTRARALASFEALIALDVPADGGIYCVVTPRQWSQLLTLDEFASADWVDSKPFVEGAPSPGRFRTWLGVNWGFHTGLPGMGTSTAKCFMWHRTSIGHASGADVTTDITWHGDHAAHFINNMMSQGACLIDANGALEIQVDDTTAISAS